MRLSADFGLFCTQFTHSSRTVNQGRTRPAKFSFEVFPFGPFIEHKRKIIAISFPDPREIAALRRGRRSRVIQRLTSTAPFRNHTTSSPRQTNTALRGGNADHSRVLRCNSDYDYLTLTPSAYPVNLASSAAIRRNAVINQILLKGVGNGQG